MKPHQPVLVAPAGANKTRHVAPVDNDSCRRVFHRRRVIPVNHYDHLLLASAEPYPEIVFAIWQIEVDRSKSIRIDAGRVVAAKALDVFNLHLAVGRKAAHRHAVCVRVQVRAHQGNRIQKPVVVRAAGNSHPRRDVIGGKCAARELQGRELVLKVERAVVRRIQEQPIEAYRNVRRRNARRHTPLKVGA